MNRFVFLFDLDWTLVSTGGAGIRALDHAFLQQYRIKDAMKKITPDGKTDPAIIREMIQAHLRRNPHPGEITALCQAYVQRLKVEVATTPQYVVLPGIPELLEALSHRPDVYVGLGTGNLEEGAQAKLARSQLLRYFKFGGYSSDAENRAEVLRAAVQRGSALAGRGLPPEHVYVIGDNFRDILAGKAIGARTVAVATGRMSLPELAESDPDYLFKDFSRTRDVLTALLPHVP